MKNDKVSICLLYPDLLGTYGDGGNALVLAQRLAWRGIAHEVVTVNTGENVPTSCDIYLLGGGEDQPQATVADQLVQSGALNKAVDGGAAVLAVCAGMQIVGESFHFGNGSKGGAGILDVVTERGPGSRRLGEVIIEPDPALLTSQLSGFENHGGDTRLGPSAKPLGRVIKGHGNDGQGQEGAVSGRVIGTYLHGPVLARNPELADRLLGWATGAEMSPLDDTEVEELRNERFAAPGRDIPAGDVFKRLALLARSRLKR